MTGRWELWTLHFDVLGVRMWEYGVRSTVDVYVAVLIISRCSFRNGDGCVGMQVRRVPQVILHGIYILHLRHSYK